MSLQQSVRKIVRETRDHAGDKITVSAVSDGVDGAFKQVKAHYLFSKHRGNAVKDEYFGNFEAAENKLLEKKGVGEAVIHT